MDTRGSSKGSGSAVRRSRPARVLARERQLVGTVAQRLPTCLISDNLSDADAEPCQSQSPGARRWFRLLLGNLSGGYRIQSTLRHRFHSVRRREELYEGPGHIRMSCTNRDTSREYG